MAQHGVTRGVERFMSKWIAAEEVRVGQRHAVEVVVVVYPEVTRTKERIITQSKLARAVSLAAIDRPQIMARTCVLIREFFCF